MERPTEEIMRLNSCQADGLTTTEQMDIVDYILHLENRLSAAEKVIEEIGVLHEDVLKHPKQYMNEVVDIILAYRSESGKEKSE